jgi:hypothetical protein
VIFVAEVKIESNYRGTEWAVTIAESASTGGMSVKECDLPQRVRVALAQWMSEPKVQDSAVLQRCTLRPWPTQGDEIGPPPKCPQCQHNVLMHDDDGACAVCAAWLSARNVVRL